MTSPKRQRLGLVIGGNWHASLGSLPRTALSAALLGILSFALGQPHLAWSECERISLNQEFRWIVGFNQSLFRASTPSSNRWNSSITMLCKRPRQMGNYGACG